jgi:hypothetical protein
MDEAEAERPAPIAAFTERSALRTAMEEFSISPRLKSIAASVKLFRPVIGVKNSGDV